MKFRFTPRAFLGVAGAIALTAIACSDPVSPDRSVDLAAPNGPSFDELTPDGARVSLPLAPRFGTGSPDGKPNLSVAPGSYRIVTLGALAGAPANASSNSQAVNDSGWVAGWSDVATPSGAQHAFLWKNGVMTDLGTLGGPSSRAYGISNTGKVVGWAHPSSGGAHAVLWQNGTMTDLGVLSGYAATAATAINEQGQIFGYAQSSTGKYRAVQFTVGSAPVSLGGLPGGDQSIVYGLNENGDVVGAANVTTGGKLFPALKKFGQPWVRLTGLTGETSGYAWDVNAKGEVAGYSFLTGSSGAVDRAARWDTTAAHAVQNLGTLPNGTISYAFGLSDSGRVVGWTGFTDGTRRATLFTASEGLQAMGEPTGAWGSQATGIAPGGKWSSGVALMNGYNVAARWELVPQVPITVPDSSPEWLYADSLYARDVPGYAGSNVSRNVVWVAFHDNSTQAERQAAISAVDGEVVGGARWDANGLAGRYFVRIPSDTIGSGVTPAIATLRTQSAIDMAGALLGGAATLSYVTPNDGTGWTRNSWSRPGTPASTSFRRALELINAPLAWGCETGDSTVPVAVIDGGLYRNVDDYNWNLGASGIRGFRIDKWTASKVWPTHLSELRTQDSVMAHGTRTASIIAARGNNGVGMTGVMWSADLRYETAQITGIGTTAYPGAAKAVENREINSILDGVARQIRMGARVINLSTNWHFVPQGTQAFASESLYNVNFIDSLWALNDAVTTSRQPLFVISAGNDSADAARDYIIQALRRPRWANRTLVVAAANSQGNALVGFSNWGDQVDVVAPGEYVAGLNAYSQVDTASGTSFSAPLVTGVAGLLLSFDPSLTASDVRQYILAGGSASIAVPGASTTRPFLDAYGALKRAARRKGAPLCGNRVWTEDSTVVVEREPNNPASYDTIYRAPTLLLRVDPEHGGKRVNVLASDTLRSVTTLSWSGGGWLPSTTDANYASLVQQLAVWTDHFWVTPPALTHGRDSVLVVIRSEVTSRPIVLGQVYLQAIRDTLLQTPIATVPNFWTGTSTQQTWDSPIYSTDNVDEPAAASISPSGDIVVSSLAFSDVCVGDGGSVSCLLGSWTSAIYLVNRASGTRESTPVIAFSATEGYAFALAYSHNGDELAVSRISPIGTVACFEDYYSTATWQRLTTVSTQCSTLVGDGLLSNLVSSAKHRRLIPRIRP